MNKFKKEKYIRQIQNKDGWSFRVRYKNVEKAFNEKDFLSASQAFKRAVAFRNSILVERIFDKGKTVDDCFNEIDSIYVLRAETKRKINIYYKYIRDKNKPIVDVTRADIIGDLNAMVETHSNDYICRVLSIWNKIFGVAVAKGYCGRDMTTNIKAPSSHKLKPSKRYELTDEQTLDTLANHLEKALQFPLERSQARNVLFILYYTGMRPAELFALNKADVDPKARRITVDKELGSDRDQEYVVRPCKTEQSHRTVPISDKCLGYIKDALASGDSPLLFPNRTGGYHKVSLLGWKYHRLAKQLGIDFHFYQCRHTFITNLFMKGVDLKTIQNIVGQRIDSTTIGYVVSDKNKEENAVNLI